MALLLHIETATTMCSVAVSRNGELLSLMEINAGYSHAENLSIFCNEVLVKSNLKFSDLQAVALSKGPGSYTGLRIGSSTAKGFCFALEIPLLSVNTLQHMALQISTKHTLKDALFCPMIDARRMEVYCALYDAQNKEVHPTEAKIIDELSFEEQLKSTQIIFFGDGASKCKSKLGKHTNAVFIEDIFPSSKDMISLAEQKFKQKNFEDTAYFEPYYLKDFLPGGSN